MTSSYKTSDVSASGSAGRRNSDTAYGSISRLLHWSIAALIIANFIVGLVSGSYDRTDVAREPIVFIHKSLGLAILALVLVRIAWILRSPGPALPSFLKRWEARLAWVTHKLLYLLMLAIPITGIMLSQSAGREVSFFGFFELPQIFPFDPSVPAGERPLVIAGAILHKVVLKWVLPMAVLAHLAGVIKHHLIDRHPQFLARMWR